MCACCVFSCHVQRKHITDYACLQGYAFPLITMSFMRHMRLKCARYNCMVILCLKCVCMHIMYWSCSWLVMCQADYDIKGYAFPLITIAFMRIAKVCYVCLHLSDSEVCACMLCIGADHLPREHTSLTTMTSMDMCFPGLFYHVLYVDSHSCTLLCTYTFLSVCMLCFLVMVRGMIMTSRDMCFPHNHVLYEDS